MRSYPVRVSRDGKWWMARATDFDNAVTQARRLSEVEATARDMIAALEDVAVDAVAVDITLESFDGVDLDAVTRIIGDARSDIEFRQSAYSDLLRGEARRLAKSGITVRDIGAILSVSHQRAQQLLEA